MAVSLPVMVTLSASEEVTIVSGPVVLTDLIVAETSTAAPASIYVAGAEDAKMCATIAVPASGSVAWHGRLVMGSGIEVGAQFGEAAVTVGYY